MNPTIPGYSTFRPDSVSTLSAQSSSDTRSRRQKDSTSASFSQRSGISTGRAQGSALLTLGVEPAHPANAKAASDRNRFRISFRLQFIG